MLDVSVTLCINTPDSGVVTSVTMPHLSGHVSRNFPKLSTFEKSRDVLS
jgi:hypothetical protein